MIIHNLPVVIRWINSVSIFKSPHFFVKLMKMGMKMEDVCDFIGDLSSVATLILFAMYFIGRFWNVQVSKKNLYEKIEIVSTDEAGINKIHHINGNEILKITSECYLNWIKIYALDYKNGKTIKSVKRVLKTVYDINRNEPVFLGLNVPEGIPNTMIRYERYDYIVGEFIVYYDGKGNGYSSRDYKFRTPIKAYLYYMFK